jgi:hypothetical protein
MNYIIDGEVVDTYGGGYTYRDVWYEIEDGEVVFYESYYGAKPSPTERISYKDEIEELLKLIK